MAERWEPIRKDKLFFFGDWERTTQRQFAFRTLTVPTAAIRSGDFSAFPTTIYDPNTGNADGTARSQIACNGALNVICPGRIDPAAAKLISLIPSPNLPGETNNYFATGNAQFTRDNFDVKINYVPSQKSMVFGRYSFSRSHIFDPPALGPAGGDATAGGQQGNADSRIQNVGLGATYSFAPAVLADWNFGFTRQRLNAQDVDINQNFGLDTLKIPGTNGADPLQGGVPFFFVHNLL